MNQPLDIEWFKVTGLGFGINAQIESVPVYKSTSARVWLNAVHYEKKSTEYHCYFETRQQAVEYIRKRLCTKRESLQRQLAEVNEALGKWDAPS